MLTKLFFFSKKNSDADWFSLTMLLVFILFNYLTDDYSYSHSTFLGQFYADLSIFKNKTFTNC